MLYVRDTSQLFAVAARRVLVGVALMAISWLAYVDVDWPVHWLIIDTLRMILALVGGIGALLVLAIFVTYGEQKSILKHYVERNDVDAFNAHLRKTWYLKIGDRAW